MQCSLTGCLLSQYSKFCSEHLVFVDRRIGFGRTSWSPLGIALIQLSQFHHDQQYQILPAYAQGGIVLSRVFRSSTDASGSGDSIDSLSAIVGSGLS